MVRHGLAPRYWNAASGAPLRLTRSCQERPHASHSTSSTSIYSHAVVATNSTATACDVVDKKRLDTRRPKCASIVERRVPEVCEHV